MARRVILDTQYTFTPATRTIVIPRIIPRERFLLITNVTTNKVIYNFSDPALTITSFSQSQGTNTTNPTTTIVLNYNTTTMSATDQLSITIDEAAEVFVPDEALLDGSQKLRISTPQALIDTDFEYGLQPTKWETITLLNNRPSFYVNPQSPTVITNVTAVNGSATVTVFTSSPPTVGTPFSMQDSLFGGGNGNFVVETVSAGTSFTYTARYAYTGTTGSVYDSTLTQVYSGAFYSNSAFSLVSQPTYSGSTITVNTVEAHGLQLGDGVFITGSSASSNPPNGSFQVSSVLSNTVFQVISYQGTPTGSITGATVYARPDGIYIHRPFDGGVQFTCTNAAHGNQIIRQTRRYFRYQSGKAIAMSTGTILKPNFNIDDISASGTTVTVTTKVAHYASPGTGIIVAGCNESAYNGTFTINQVIDAFRFTYNANTVPSASPASGTPVVVVSTWYGARSRTGLYDNQNGVFFEYDGQQLYAVRRFSTYQIAGFALVTNNSSLVTGAVGPGGVINTKFSKQLTPGDFIVIRGMSYRVLDILSDSAMTVSPPYRGPTLSGTNGVVISKTIDIKVPQSQFNLDRLDGTGPSGFVLDLSKMQMFYLDYSWYGAGTIRFGFRAADGKIVYCHRFVNNNQNYLAWMRSGNLPARYETNTLAPVTTLSSTLSSANSTMSVANTSGFPPAGTLLIANPSNYEYVNYTGLTPTTFTGLTRGQLGSQVASVGTTANNANVTTSSSVGGVQPGMFVTGTNIPNNTFVYAVYPGLTNTIQLTQAATGTGTTTLTLSQMGGAANTHTYSNTALIPVHLHLPAVAPTIDHWGTSVIMDGRFDDDKSLIYFYGEPVFTSIPAGTTYALMSIRVSPSVDSGIPATLGLKELINRMQLKLQSVELLVSGSFLISLVLNGSISSAGGTVGTFQRVAVGTSSLSQIADHTGAVTISGGENIFGTYGVNTAGTGNISNIYQDLTQVRDLGNSILGGGYSNAGNSPFYPDGPDVVTVVATNLGAASANVIARLGWTEAQA
jgi:hypothetical protein